jgi:carboxylesterase
MKQPYGVLILHGFASSLDSVRGIQPPLKAMGLPTLLPALRGHNQKSPEALRGVTWHDWVADAEAALHSLLYDAGKVIVVGHSMGGLIALNLAANHPDTVDSIVPAAASVQLFYGGIIHIFQPLVRRFFDQWDMPTLFSDEDLARFDTNYQWAPMDSITSFLELVEVTRRRLPEVRVPTLILQSRKDTVTAPRSAEIIYDRISTPPEQKRIVWFKNTQHEMFRDCEREAVIETVADYVAERAGIKK